MRNLDGEIQALLTRATPCNDNQPSTILKTKALEAPVVNGINVVGNHNVVISMHSLALPFVLTLFYILFVACNH